MRRSTPARFHVACRHADVPSNTAPTSTAIARRVTFFLRGVTPTIAAPECPGEHNVTNAHDITLLFVNAASLPADPRQARPGTAPLAPKRERIAEYPHPAPAITLARLTQRDTLELRIAGRTVENAGRVYDRTMNTALRIAGLSIGLLAAAGCQQSRPPVQVAEAPFEVVDGALLRVRSDILASLKFATAQKSEVSAEISGLGEVTFAPGAAYALRVPFGGFVETVNVGVGEVVAENQVLATIHSSELAKLRSEYRRITEELASQADALQSAKSLDSTASIPRRRLIELQAAVGSLEAQRDGIRHALTAARTDEKGQDLLELRAPRAGHVIVRRLDPGELAEDPDNVPAFVIADPRRLVVKASFPERDAPLLAVDFPCRVTVSSLGETPFTGRVAAVVQAINPNSRTVEVRCDFESVDSRLRAEMLARVVVSVSGPPRLFVPRSAVLLRRDARVVLVRRGATDLERRTVAVGAHLDSKLEILSGLEEGDEVVVEGAVLLDGELDRLL